MSISTRSWRLTSALAAVLFLSACETVELGAPDTIRTNLDGSPQSMDGATGTVDEQSASTITITGGTAFEQGGVVGRRTVSGIGSRGGVSLAGGETRMPNFDSERLSVSIPPQAVPEFVNTVFGELLGTGFTLGPGVSELQTVIAFRSASNISKRELYETASSALESYGVAVYNNEDGVQVVLRDDLKQMAPRFIRSRARASVPDSLRPVVQFVELRALSPQEMQAILRQAFPDNNRIRIEVNPQSSSITLIGLPEPVDQALAIVNQMDELRFAGRETATLTVVNWDIRELANTVQDLLIVEGYAVTAQRGIFRPITIVPLEQTNQLIIFASTRNMLDRTIEVALELDNAARPNPDDRQTRIYKARHYEAEDLSTILDNVIGLMQDDAVEDEATTTRVRPSLGDDGQDGFEGLQGSGQFVVDEQGNRIIFMASDAEYQRMLQILNTLDTPAAEVLIEVTIAEVTLTDDTQSGVEFLVSQIGSTGYSIGTLGGLGLAASGLTGAVGSDDYEVQFGLGSTNNAINVLSTPRVVTRSGATASIQVGTDVPIITTQTAGVTQVGGTTDVLQSVEYRETGILLDVTPLVLSDNRIDLEISQEVSSAEANPNQAIGSPIISNRSITSELTLQDGQSAILGGLIESRYTQGQSGVPFLKDIPILGRIFSVDTLTDRDTILLFMVTPYVLRGAADREAALRPLADEVNRAFINQKSELKTLTPRETPLTLRTQTRNDP